MGMSSSGEGSSSSHLTSQFGVSSLILKGVLATVTVAGCDGGGERGSRWI